MTTIIGCFLAYVVLGFLVCVLAYRYTRLLIHYNAISPGDTLMMWVFWPLFLLIYFPYRAFKWLGNKIGTPFDWIVGINAYFDALPQRRKQRKALRAAAEAARLKAELADTKQHYLLNRKWSP